MPDGYTLIYKAVKHARLRVSEDGSVCVIVPNSFTTQDIEALLDKKKKWIGNQLAFFSQKAKIELGRNQLLLFGNRYNYFYDDHAEKTW